MNPIKFGILALVSISITISAQEYIEASGQTVSFTLAAGNKAAWNPQASPIIHQSYSHQVSANPLMKIQTIGSGVRFLITNYSSADTRMMVFDIRGKLRNEFIFDKRSEQLAISKRYPSGRYVARLTSGASTCQTQSFTVVR